MLLEQKTVLLLGGSGQVGYELKKRLTNNSSFIAPSRKELDLCNRENLVNFLDKHKPDIILNAAAYTGVDNAEIERDLSMKMNGDLPRYLAKWSALNGGLLLHYSSDYTLAGSGCAPHSEREVMHPQNWYGYSKSLGDKAILESSCQSLIIRTSWVYSDHHQNFLRSIIEKVETQETLAVVNDQYGTPTPADWLAQISLKLLQNINYKTPKLINAVPSGFTSWFGFAEKILHTLRELEHPMKVQQLVPRSTEELNQTACRPLNSRLENHLLTKHIGSVIKSWDEYASEVISNYLR